MQNPIDLTEIRTGFFKDLWDSFQVPKNKEYKDDLDNKNINIDIKYLTRDNLPDKVRPAPSEKKSARIPAIDPFQNLNQPRVGTKRAYHESTDPQQNDNDATGLLINDDD